MITKTFYSILALCMLFFLSACGHITQLTLSEEMLNHALQHHANYTKQINIPKLGKANVVLHDLNLQVGRNAVNTITIKGNMSLDADTLFGNYHGLLHLTLTATPWFDPVKGEIYLKEAHITDYTQDNNQDSTLTTLLEPMLNPLLSQYFNSTPIYQLDAKRSEAEKLALDHAKGIKVEPGNVIIAL